MTINAVDETLLFLSDGTTKIFPAEENLIFQENFDAQADWHGDTNEDVVEQFPWDGRTIPAGWHAARHLPHWAPSTGHGDRHEAMEILASNSAKAKGGTGKSFVHWRDSTDTGSSSQHKGEGLLTWYAGAGTEYTELYVEFFIQISNETVSAFYSPGLGASKIFRMYHWDEVQNTYFSFFSNASSPKFIWNWLGNAFGYRNQLSLRAVGDNDMGNPTFPSPQILNGDWSGSFTSSIAGQAVGGGDPEVEDKKNGGNIPIDGPSIDIDQILGDEIYTRIAFHVKLNSSPGVGDGELRQWIDDERILEVTDIEWIRSGQSVQGWNIVAIGGNHFFDTFPEGDRHEDWYSIDELKIYSAIPTGRGLV